MPKYQLDIPHTLGADEAKKRIDEATGKLSSDYGASCSWKSDNELAVSRKGLDARVTLEPSRVRIDLNLGLPHDAVRGADQDRHHEEAVRDPGERSHAHRLIAARASAGHAACFPSSAGPDASPGAACACSRRSRSRRQAASASCDPKTRSENGIEMLKFTHRIRFRRW